MSQSRILCVVTADSITRPSARHYENNRIYQYPDPGTVIHCKAEGIVVRMVSSPAAEESQLNKSFRWDSGIVDIGFGMVVFDDMQTKQEKSQVIPLEDSQREFEIITTLGEERAKDLAHQWKHYGCVMMGGEAPTDKEMETAKEYRREYGLNRLNDAIDMQNKRRGGMKGIKPNFDRSDRAWAKEFGVALVDTVELLPRHPGASQAPAQQDVARVPCPECGESIPTTAKVCHFCRSKFGGLTVTDRIELSKQPAEQEVTT